MGRAEGNINTRDEAGKQSLVLVVQNVIVALVGIILILLAVIDLNDEEEVVVLGIILGAALLFTALVGWVACAIRVKAMLIIYVILAIGAAGFALACMVLFIINKDTTRRIAFIVLSAFALLTKGTAAYTGIMIIKFMGD